MSSFLAIREGSQPIVVGNCTFDLLFGKIKGSSSERIARVFSANPIADTMGYLNMKDLEMREIEAMIPLVDELIEEQEPSREGTGFDLMGDLRRLRSSLVDATDDLKADC